MRWFLPAILCAFCSGASAQDVRTNIGVLTCTLAEHGESQEVPPSQTRDMLCSFKPTGGAEESYSGSIRMVGVAQELTGKLVLIWTVLGPKEGELAPGLLQQTYIGESGDSPTGAPQPPKVLVGEKNKALGLQPMTDTRGENASASVTVVELKVKSVPA